MTFVGAFTAFFAATVGLVQNDIKRVIAYSTCSQLGYMFVALGVGAYAVGIFHLFTHAFFKALLFLGSGSVIHAMSDEQDMRKMGGLRTRIPVTYWLMIIGTLALTGVGIPAHHRTAGYFSKDAIIEARLRRRERDGRRSPSSLLVVAAMFTSFYSWRLMFMTFHGRPRAPAEVMDHVHESPAGDAHAARRPGRRRALRRLALRDYFIGHDYEHFWKASLFRCPKTISSRRSTTSPFWVKLAPFVAMLLGFVIAWHFYIRRPETPVRLAEQHRGLYRFLLNKWYFDELYDVLLVRPAMALGRFLWKRGDGWLIDGFGPDGVSARVIDVTRNVVRLQTGYLYHYAFAMLLGVARPRHLDDVRGMMARIDELARSSPTVTYPAAGRGGDHVLCFIRGETRRRIRQQHPERGARRRPR